MSFSLEERLNAASRSEIRIQIERKFPQRRSHAPGLTNASFRVIKAISRAKQRLGRLPADPEVARVLGMSTATYQNLLLFLLRAKAVALKESEPFEATLVSLPQYHAKVLALCFLEGKHETQIAQELQTTAQRIALTTASTLHHLAKPLTGITC